MLTGITTLLPSSPAFFNQRLTAGTTSGLNVVLTVYLIKKYQLLDHT